MFKIIIKNKVTLREKERDRSEREIKIELRIYRFKLFPLIQKKSKYVSIYFVFVFIVMNKIGKVLLFFLVFTAKP